MKHRKRNIISCLLVILVLIGPPNVIALSVQSVETEGSIHFSGVYEPIGTPDPPPSNIVKPAIGGELPQTNAKIQNHWIWLGWLFIGLVVIAGIKKKYQEQKNRENKRGNHT
ncbi:LPXTG cell wall anchor domain-containing protein [Enterococcus mundtii]|uniref:LPXTG cell wall anchor domain-containing protein n=1 Tax=Enterococcus mundtii TaxID=53346 RepID=UPI001929D96A|nr:LPXTG cell wall anchor domain-containing protein [Enterococcus mundtii]